MRRARNVAAHWAAATVVCLVLCPALRAAGPSDATLVALFPKPPASVATRLEADFQGDGRSAVAVVYDTPLAGRWRLALVTVDGQGRWRLSAPNLKVHPATAPWRLVTTDLTGDGLPELVTTCRGDDGWRYTVFSARGGLLVALLALAGDGEPPTVRDIDGDGCPELVRETPEPLLAGPSLPVEWRLELHRWDGAAFVAGAWRAVPGDATVALRLRRYADGHLWRQVVATAEDSYRRGAEPATVWNRWVAQHLAERYREQTLTAKGPVAKGLAWALAGEFEQAAAALLAPGGPAAMPPDWEEPVARLRPVCEQAVAAQATLGGDAALLALRGLAQLAADNEAAARVSFTRARAASPDLPGLAAWYGVGAARWRLWFVGRAGHLQAADVTALGRPLGRVSEWPEWGAARAVAAAPVGPEVAWVPLGGDSVRLAGADRREQTLVEGRLLSLAAHAFAPDGRLLAVDVGAGLVRELWLVRVPTGREAGRLRYAGAFAWAPDGRRLAIEQARAVEPPFPWADGGTRDIALVDQRGRELRRLARGDATTLWSLEDWPQPAQVWAREQTVVRAGLAGLRVERARHCILGVEDGKLTERNAEAPEVEQALVAARVGQGVEAEVVTGVNLPGLVLYRRAEPDGATLWALRRDERGEPRRIAPVPALDRPLVISRGAP